MRYAIVLSLMVFLSSSAGAGDYFQNMSKQLNFLARETSFFQKDVCPTVAAPSECFDKLSTQLKQLERLHRELRNANIRYQMMKMNIAEPLSVAESMTEFRRKLMLSVQDARAVLYRYAD